MDQPQASEHSTPLVEQLILSAHNHLEGAREASERKHAFGFQRGDSIRLAALHAGISIELLSKAVYAANTDVKSVKKASAWKTLKFVWHRYPSLETLRDSVENALETRNTAAHEAVPPETATVEDAVIAAESFKAAALGVLDREISEYVAEVRVAVWEAEVGQQLDERGRNAREKIWNAYETYKRQRQGLAPERALILDGILLSRPQPIAPSRAVTHRDVVCLACEYVGARVWSYLEEAAIEVPVSLQCPRCDLHLDSDELWVAGIDVNL